MQMDPCLFSPSAQWIQSGLVGSPHTGVPAPVFRKTFTLKAPAENAVLRWTCLGIAEVTLDGSPVHDGVFLPGWTDTRKRLRVMDIPLGTLPLGEHTLEAVLGDGWAVGHVAMNPRQHDADRPKFIAELSWDGGSIATDGSWQTFPSPIVANDLLMGEHHDARLEHPSTPDTRHTTPDTCHATPATFDPPPLQLHTDPVVKPQESFP
jgi:alpha-L-rhamnosidase